MTEDRVPVTVKSLEKGISDPHNTMFFFLRRIASSVSVAWKYRSVEANI